MLSEVKTLLTLLKEQTVVKKEQRAKHQGRHSSGELSPNDVVID